MGWMEQRRLSASSRTSEFFFSYAEQYGQHHKETPMDAIVLDINHFSIISERHGRAYADEVLRRVGEKARDMVHDSGGIVCRREADIFLVYCPHREDYKAILDNASKELASEQEANKRIRLRMGVYPNVDKSLDLEQRFYHAKSACDSVRNSFTNYIGFYDDKLHKANLYAERLIDDFGDAIEQGQFRVYFQPKFNIAGDEPYGQDVGDEVLKRVAEVLTHSFKSTDLVFRLGADEYVVIMANVDGSDKAKLQRTIDHANVMLKNPKGVCRQPPLALARRSLIATIPKETYSRTPTPPCTS